MALRGAWWMQPLPQAPHSTTRANPQEPHKLWPWNQSTSGLSFSVLENFIKQNPGDHCKVDKYVYISGASTNGSSLWQYSETAASASAVIDLINKPEPAGTKNRVYCITDVSAEAVQALGYHLEITPRFFNVSYRPCSSGNDVKQHMYFTLQFMERYDNGIIPYESGRSESSPVACFQTSTGEAAHKWHVTRVALIFMCTSNGTEDVFKGIIQLDPHDEAIHKGLRILMTRDEEIPPGQAEEKLGLGQILSEVFYIVTFTWGVFLDEAENHLQVLSKKCVEEDLSSAEQLRYTRELHQITPLWVQVRRRLVSARDAAMQMTVHPFFVAINAQEAIESYLKKQAGILDDHIKRSEELTNQTNVLISLIFNIATLQDTRAAMEESKAAHRLSASVHRVALLTFFYLPLTLAAGIYGMNLRQISGEAAQGHIVNFVILSVCLMAATIGAWFTWSKLLTRWVEYRSKLLSNIRVSRV